MDFDYEGELSKIQKIRDLAKTMNVAIVIQNQIQKVESELSTNIDMLRNIEVIIDKNRFNKNSDIYHVKQIDLEKLKESIEYSVYALLNDCSNLDDEDDDYYDENELEDLSMEGDTLSEYEDDDEADYWKEL